MYIRIAAASLIVLAVTGCATPRYQNRIFPLSSSPSVPLEQAKAICGPRATIAAQQAANNARAASHNAQPYKCDSSQNGVGGYSTTCNQEAPSGLGGGLMALADSNTANDAGRRAGEIVVKGCMAEYGWGMQRRCVENCN